MNREQLASFREGAHAAIPVCFGFLAVTFALGIAANARGLSAGEILLMSAVVFAAPAQFPAIELLPMGGQALQILLGTFFINLRFALMSFALVPHLKPVRTGGLMAGAQLVTMGTFAVSFLRFQWKSAPDNLVYFLGVAIPSYLCYLLGTMAGYHFGGRVPGGFEEGIQLIFPAYLTALLASELRERRSIAVVGVAFLTTPVVETLVPGWGLILNAIVVATAAVGIETWRQSASPSS
jgi:predicted branched-subunit amino acid permease